MKLSPKDTDSLISAYSFVLNKPGQIPKNDVPEHIPELKEYVLDLTAYANLMGGPLCNNN